MPYAGVDIAKADHVVGAVDDRGARVARQMPLKNSEAGFERCAEWLEGVAAEPSDVLVGMEAAGHHWRALLAFLVARGCRVCVIDPVQVRAVRKLKGLDRVKNDRVDSELIAETLRIGQFDETRLTDERVEPLRTLTRYHQSLRAEAAEAKTQLLCVLDAYFPEYERLFSDPFCAPSPALLALAPLPADLARRREKTVADALSAAPRGRIGREGAAEVKAAARSSVGYRAGSGAASFEVRPLVRAIEFLESEASQVAGRVAALLSEVEPPVLTIPGVGGVTGAQIVAEIGDMARFPNAKALVRYAGLDSSGQPVRTVRLRGRPDHQARLAVPEARGLARSQQGLAARRAPGRLLQEETVGGQAAQGRRHRRREKAVPRDIRRHARPGGIRRVKVRALPSQAFDIQL